MTKKNLDLTNKLKKNENIFNSLFSLFSLFEKNKFELFLVGGCVRDLLLGKSPKDYDLCTNATPDEIKIICERENLKTFDSGIKHGTLTVIDDFYNQSYEITTYRVEGKYIAGRHPNEVDFTASLEEDLKRRDFTINSFAYNLLTKELFALDESYFRDLEIEIIRTVGDPEDRFNEDALRMLRALRFSAELGFTINKNTYEAIKTQAYLIEKVSKERIRDELTKILLSNHPETLELLVTSGLEDYLFNGITPLKDMLNCEHENPWHYADVFHHTLDVVRSVPCNFELRWAALLHDCGKPKVKQPRPEGPAGHYVYYGHPEISAQISLEVMNILKFSNDEKEMIFKYIKYHDADLSECKISNFKKILNDIGKSNFLNFIKLRQADANAHKLIRSTQYAIDSIDKIKKRYLKIIIDDEALKVTDLDINGNDIIMYGGLKGKQIGACLRWMLEKVLENSKLNNKKDLLELLKKFKETEL